MIGKISFLGQIPTKNSEIKTPEFHTKPMENDTFVRSEKPFDKKAAAIAYAKDRIIKELQDTGFEYQVVVSPDGEILDEGVGDETSCPVNKPKIMPNSELYHGHPTPWPLSADDIALLLTTDAISEKVFLKDGKFSKLTKKNAFKLPEETSDINEKLQKEIFLMTLRELGVDYITNMDDAITMGRDYLEYNTGKMYDPSNPSEVIEDLKKQGIDMTKEPKEIMAQLKDLMYYQLSAQPDKYDKEQNAIKDNFNRMLKFLTTPEGIKVRQEFARKIAQDYDLIYETDME